MSRTRRILALTAAALIALAAVGLLGYEFAPVIAFDAGLTAPAWPADTALADMVPAGAVRTRTGPRTGDRVVIPRIAVDAPVVRGRDDGALRRGAWLQPPSVAPGTPGTTVLAGHRVRSQFVLLHEVRRGDVVIVYWKGREYDYRVRRTATLSGTAPRTPVTVGGRERLVLYTCTPRWQGDLRAVVYADRIPEPQAPSDVSTATP